MLGFTDYADDRLFKSIVADIMRELKDCEAVSTEQIAQIAAFAAITAIKKMR